MSPLWFLLLRVLTSLFACFVLPHSLARGSSLPGILAANYAYDANDRLTTDLYDQNGNTRSATLRPHTSGAPVGVNDRYDFENRLVDRNSGQLTVVYDGDGHRVRKTVGGVTTFYLVDDLNPTGYAQVVEELVSINPQPPTLNRAYTWGHALLAQALFNPGTQTLDASSYYGYDGQASVRFLTDHNGQVTDTYDYDAFGNLISQFASTQTPSPNPTSATGGAI